MAGVAPQGLRHHGAGLFRLRPATDLYRHASAELSGALRPGAGARRHGARRHRRLQRDWLLHSGLDGRQVSQACAAGFGLYPEIGVYRGLFPASRHADHDPDFCRRDGSIVARRRAAGNRNGQSDVRASLCRDTDRRRVLFSPDGFVYRCLGRWADCRYVRILRPGLADRRRHRRDGRNRPDICR